MTCGLHWDPEIPKCFMFALITQSCKQAKHQPKTCFSSHARITEQTSRPKGPESDMEGATPQTAADLHVTDLLVPSEPYRGHSSDRSPQHLSWTGPSSSPAGDVGKFF
ncbi:hypothetical protein AMECASPLE_032376 [Ameca splendens]|uniref:Uncharacterized protein n=1 Tax=Ameca splendens TaxID=208324 RepID=A0ABV0Z550_9TELE